MPLAVMTYKQKTFPLLQRAIANFKKSEGAESKEQIKTTIRSLITDKTLSQAVSLQLPNETSSRDIPSQIIQDIHRSGRMVVNGKTLYDLVLVEKEDEEKKSKGISNLEITQFREQQKVQILKDIVDALCLGSHESPEEIQSSFFRLGMLMNQAFVTGACGKLHKVLSHLNIQDIYLTDTDAKNGGALRFDISITPQQINLTVKTIFVYKSTYGILFDINNLPLGYVAWKQELTLVRNELNQQLETLTPEEILPHVEVKEQFSDFCLTPLEAQRNLESPAYWSWFKQS